MSKRLEILLRSLEKKKAKVDALIQTHFDTVKLANGQPLNDKRNGRATLAKWDKQNDAIRRAMEDIKVTEEAIEREQRAITRVEKTELPEILANAVANGELQQWRKFPNTFFVPGVDKARIVWDASKKQLAYRYLSAITDGEQRKKFAQIYNSLFAQLKD